MHDLRVIPLPCSRQFGRFDLTSTIRKNLRKNKVTLRSGDVVVVSSKFVAMSEGRYVNLKKVSPSRKATEFAKLYALDPALAELVLKESDSIIGGVKGFALSLSGEVLAPNAGIDKSNVPHGYAILYPKDPGKSAARLREGLLKEIRKSREKIELGVVISDSRIAPTRQGTVGVALAVAGMKATLDFRGLKDLFGNELKVTVRAIADQVATAAELLMGEASESVPVVVVRGVEGIFGPLRSNNESLLTIPPERCLIVQGLENGFRNRKSVRPC